MFTSTTTSDHYSNSTKWKYNQVEVAPNCPRCASSNTKFCYYNNYSLSQPRYFCKGCRRYWTKGGSLRNVPVGGGCRKSRRARATIRGAASYPHPAPSAESNGGACIDMAAVFAKYVNQNQNAAEIEESSLSPGSSENVNSVGVDSRLEDMSMTTFAEYQLRKQLGFDDQIQMQQQQQQQGIPQLSTCQDITSQQFVYQEDCQQQGVLCDELSPDMLWSEGTTPPLPNYGFQQPMVQVEDCGLFAADDDDDDDQLRISANLVTDDNWGSFDLSAYDFYSTP